MDLLTVPEVGKELGISKALAYRLLHTDALPYVRLSSRRQAVRRQALAAWLETRIRVEGRAR